MNDIQEIYIAGRNKLIIKKMKTPRILLAVKDGNNHVIVRLFRPKSYISNLYNKVRKLIKR